MGNTTDENAYRNTDDLHIAYVDSHYSSFSSSWHSRRPEQIPRRNVKVVMIGPNDSQADSSVDSKTRIYHAYLSRQGQTPSSTPITLDSSFGLVSFWDTNRGDQPDRLQRRYAGADTVLLFCPLDTDESATNTSTVQMMGDLMMEAEQCAPQVPVVLLGYTHGQRPLGPGTEKAWDPETGVEVKLPWFTRTSKPKDVDVKVGQVWKGADKGKISWNEGLELAKMLGAVAYAEVDSADGKGMKIFDEMSLIGRARHPTHKRGALLDAVCSIM